MWNSIPKQKTTTKTEKRPTTNHILIFHILNVIITINFIISIIILTINYDLCKLQLMCSGVLIVWHELMWEMQMKFCATWKKERKQQTKEGRNKGRKSSYDTNEMIKCQKWNTILHYAETVDQNDRNEWSYDLFVAPHLLYICSDLVSLHEMKCVKVKKDIESAFCWHAWFELSFFSQ